MSRDMFKSINEVSGFNIASLVSKQKNEGGDDWSMIKLSDRLNWFHLKYPNGSVIPAIVSETDSRVLFETKLYATTTDALPISVGYGAANFIARTESEKAYTGIKAYASAESQSIARALNNAGFSVSNFTDSENEYDVELEPEQLPASSPTPASKPKPEPKSGSKSSGSKSKSEPEPKPEPESESTGTVGAFDAMTEKLVESELKKLTKKAAFDTVISFGVLKNKTLREAVEENKGEDKVSELRKYAELDLAKINITEVRSVAACIFLVREFDKK